MRNYTFTLKRESTSETEEIKVKAHAFPDAASQVYVLTHPKRTKGWCIVSGVDEDCRDS